jgi:hypothetical protein
MDEANSQGSTLLQQGIAAARAKRKGEAYQLLRQVVTSDPRNSAAWLWLGAVAPTPQEQLQAFDQVLALDPTNEKAQTGRRWALGRLGGGPGGAPAAAPPAAPSGGISSQAMLGMFGGGPGAAPGPAAPPPTPAAPPAAPSGGMSSQDLLGMFGGGMPDAPARTDLSPPPGPRAPEVSDRFAPPSGPAAPAPRATSAPAPRETGSGLDLATPQPFDPSMFGASQAVPPPPSSPLPPGAPGTPGGVEWRGYSDLQDTEAFNWDDSGLGLSARAAAPGAPPPGAARPEARPVETYPAAPSIFSDLDRDDQDAPRMDAGAAVAELPPPLAERRGTPTLVLLGAVALIVLLLLIGILSALLANNTITLSATSGPEDTVQNVLDAHVSTRYTEASAYLVPALASEYRPIDSPLHISLPDPRRIRGLSARVAPLTTDAERAEVYGFFTSSATPAPETLNPAPWTFTLEKRETGWLITGITPP